MFPFSIRGSVSVELTGNSIPQIEQATLARLHDRLLKEKPKYVQTEQNVLQFKRNFLHLFNFRKLLEFIDGGSIPIEPDGMGLRAEYQLWFTSFIVEFTLVFIFVEYQFYARGGWMFSLPNDILMWLFILVVNIAISVIRFRIMLRAEISKV